MTFIIIASPLTSRTTFRGAFDILPKVWNNAFSRQCFVG